MLERGGVSICEKVVSSRLVGLPFFRIGDSLSVVGVSFSNISRSESNFFLRDVVLFCCWMSCSCLLNLACIASCMASSSLRWSS